MGHEMLGVVHQPRPSDDGGEIDGRTLRLAAAGDRDASRTLVEIYQRRVFALASRMLAGRGRATIEDVAQDTFLQVFRRIGERHAGHDPANDRAARRSRHRSGRAGN